MNESKQNVELNQENICHQVTRNFAEFGTSQLFVHIWNTVGLGLDTALLDRKKHTEEVQCRITRMIHSLRSMHYQGRLQQLRLRTLEDCRNRADLITDLILKFSKWLTVF